MLQLLFFRWLVFLYKNRILNKLCDKQPVNRSWNKLLQLVLRLYNEFFFFWFWL